LRSINFTSTLLDIFEKIQINLGVGRPFTKDKELFIAKKYRQHLEYYTMILMNIVENYI